MKHLKTLELEVGGEKKTILFGVPEKKEHADAMFSLRKRVYEKRGYLRAGVESDKDSYDEDPRTFHALALIEERVIGSVRMIQTNPLPIERYYSFDIPQQLKNIPRDSICEVGRLVIEKFSETTYLPRNIILLFLVVSLLEEGRARGMQASYAYLKEKLIRKLRLLRMPFSLIEPYELLYPRDGVMAPYFYDSADKAIPGCFLAHEVEAFLSSLIDNERMFEERQSRQYLLRTTMYNSFLKLLGIL